MKQAENENKVTFTFFSLTIPCDLGHTHIAKHNFNEIIFFQIDEGHAKGRREEKQSYGKVSFICKFENWNSLENWVSCKCVSDVCLCVCAPKKAFSYLEKSIDQSFVEWFYHIIVFNFFFLLFGKLHTCFFGWISYKNTSSDT